MYDIKQYDPTIFAADGDQPVVHLYAESGNEYVAQYDEEAGYFFTDQILKSVDTATLAQEIPGRIYEPLKGFDFYQYPGEPVTIQEILDCPAVRAETEYLTSEIGQYLESLGYSVDPWQDTEVPDLVKSIKTDVNYDHRRGAQVSAWYYQNQPFMVTSTAGRELDDIQNIWVLDADITQKVADHLTPSPKVEEVSRDQIVNLAYWENTPVKLGDRFWGTERPDSGRDD